MWDINYYSKYIRFAYGVKHGLIKLDDNWTFPYNNYDPRLIDNPIEDFCGENGEVYSTNYIYQCYDMEKWIEWIP
ncbi:hypothetical protein [Daejeonella sp.]|jgi:hypothetical protein|uniref:hypothetical protein n=1 Tax=Daejeonella sp. TaxID=2805397 RepID=UPI0037C05E93